MTIHSDVRGKVCIVTGANTGIGRVTAEELAAGGAQVLVACRSPERTEPVVEAIRAASGNDRVELLPLDLASFASVRRCAETFLARDQPLDLLINNAGLAGKRGLTDDGFELHFGVNHLGHFLLTCLLREPLLRSKGARVVHVASKSHYQAKGIDLEAQRRPTRSLTGLPEYAASKLANVCFNMALARRTDGTALRSYALHPGVVASDIWRNVPWPIRPIIRKFMITNEQGAQTTLYCATSPDVADHSGRYYDKSAEKRWNRVATAELAEVLWAKSVEWTGVDWGAA